MAQVAAVKGSGLQRNFYISASGVGPHREPPQARTPARVFPRTKRKVKVVRHMRVKVRVRVARIVEMRV